MTIFKAFINRCQEKTKLLNINFLVCRKVEIYALKIKLPLNLKKSLEHDIVFLDVLRTKIFNIDIETFFKVKIFMLKT